MITRKIAEPPYIEVLYICECGREFWVSGYRMSATCRVCGKPMSQKISQPTTGHPVMDKVA